MQSNGKVLIGGGFTTGSGTRELRYFVGLTTEEAADILGIAVPTANCWWSYSRAWLYQEIEWQQKL